MHRTRFGGLAGFVSASAVLLAACGGGSAVMSGSSPSQTSAPVARASAATPPVPARTAAPTPQPTTPAAPTPTTAPTPQPTSPPAADGVQQAPTATIVAKDISFDRTELTLRAGEVTITLQNEDSATPHNLAVYRDAGHTQLAGATAIMTGPTTETLPLTLQPGTYYYQCDVHPQQMHGVLTAAQ